MTTPIAAAPSRPATSVDQTFPKLTPEQVEYLAGIGAQQTFGRGDQVFGRGGGAAETGAAESGP